MRPQAWTSLLSVAPLALLALASAPAVHAIDAKEALQLVSAGIESNYASFKTIHARVQTVTETPGNDDKEHREERNGLVAISFMAKRAVLNMETWIAPSKLRADMSPDRGPPMTFFFIDGIWTQYSKDMKQAWIHRNNQMGSFDAMDLRSFGTFDAKLDIPTLLAQGRITSAAWATSGDVLLIDLVLPRGQAMSFAFDRRLSFLPVMAATRHTDATIAGCLSMTYKAHTNDGAFLLDSAVRRAFAPGDHKAPPVTANDWLQQATIKVTDVSLNRVFEVSIFDVELPAGTTIQDSVTGSVRISGWEDRTPRTRGVATLAVILAVGTTCACLAMFLYLRFRRIRSKGD
jgi:hypothetical protein